jgi:methyltransferase-like protein
MLRDMMMYHTTQFADPQAKVQQARALIEFLAQTVPTEDNPYGLWLKQELEIMRRWQDNYILHDSLEEVNEPVYFHQFMERAARQGLQYLGDANFSTMLASNFDPDVQQTLQRVGTTLVAMEQYMDFIRNRMFRHTLLCHEGLVLRRNLTPDQLQGFYITSSLASATEAPDLRSTARVDFQNANGTLTSGQPLVKAAMLFLAQQFPLAVVFERLLNQAHTMRSAEEVEVQDAAAFKRDQVMLGEALLLGFSRNLLELSLYPHPFIVNVSAYPCTTRLIRHQAETGVVTNVQHMNVNLDSATRLVVQHLDGQHDHEALLRLLLERVQAGELVVREKGEPIRDQERIRTIMNERLNLLLSSCARLGLLVA